MLRVLLLRVGKKQHGAAPRHQPGTEQAHALPDMPLPMHCTITWLCLSTWSAVTSLTPPWLTHPGTHPALSSLLSPLHPNLQPRDWGANDGATMHLVLAELARAGHLTQIRPIRLGFGLRDPGQTL